MCPFGEFCGSSNDVVVSLFNIVYYTVSFLFLGKAYPITDSHRVGRINTFNAKGAFDFTLNSVPIGFSYRVPAACRFGDYAILFVGIFRGCHRSDIGSKVYIFNFVGS